MLEIKNLRFSYPSSEGEFAFDLTVDRGEIAVVQGRSGIGKSTLLNLIAGFLTPSTGQILWQGDDLTALPPQKRPLSMIFQDGNLFDHLSCRHGFILDQGFDNFNTIQSSFGIKGAERLIKQQQVAILPFGADQCPCQGDTLLLSA